MRREEWGTVQGPVKEQQPDGMSHRGSKHGWPPLCVDSDPGPFPFFSFYVDPLTNDGSWVLSPSFPDRPKNRAFDNAQRPLGCCWVIMGGLSRFQASMGWLKYHDFWMTSDNPRVIIW